MLGETLNGQSSQPKTTGDESATSAGGLNEAEQEVPVVGADAEEADSAHPELSSVEIEAQLREILSRAWGQLSTAVALLMGQEQPNFNDVFVLRTEDFSQPTLTVEASFIDPLNQSVRLNFREKLEIKFFLIMSATGQEEPDYQLALTGIGDYPAQTTRERVYVSGNNPDDSFYVRDREMAFKGLQAFRSLDQLEQDEVESINHIVDTCIRIITDLQTGRGEKQD